MVNESAFEEAAAAGRSAVPGSSPLQDDPVVARWVARVSHYAKNVPPRIGADVADTLREYADEEPNVLIGLVSQLLDNRDFSIERYAEPTWGTGQEAYGDELQSNDVLLDWVLGDAEHCDDCLELADGSPYAKGEIPTWPGAGDTQCFDNCKCSVTPEQDSWDAVFANPEDDDEEPAE